MKDTEARIYVFVLVVGAIIGAGAVAFYASRNLQSFDRYWQQRDDSLTTANNLLSIRLDSARAESIAHEQRAESLATVPRTIYITNAQSLTRNASVDSLWLMLLTDPFVAVPETLVHHGQP